MGGPRREPGSGRSVLHDGVTLGSVDGGRPIPGLPAVAVAGILLELVLLFVPLGALATAIEALLFCLLLLPLVGLALIVGPHRGWRWLAAYLVGWTAWSAIAATLYVWALTARWSGYAVLPGAICGLAIAGCCFAAARALEGRSARILILVLILGCLVVVRVVVGALAGWP